MSWEGACRRRLDEAYLLKPDVRLFGKDFALELTATKVRTSKESSFTMTRVCYKVLVTFVLPFAYSAPSRTSHFMRFSLNMSNSLYSPQNETMTVTFHDVTETW